MAKVAHVMSKTRNRNHIPLIGQLRTLDKKLPLKLSVPPLKSELVQRTKKQALREVIARYRQNVEVMNDPTTEGHRLSPRPRLCKTTPTMPVDPFPEHRPLRELYLLLMEELKRRRNLVGDIVAQKSPLLIGIAQELCYLDEPLAILKFDSAMVGMSALCQKRKSCIVPAIVESGR